MVIFNEGLCKVAEQYLRKGSKVYLEGQLQTRKWQDQSGQERYSTEVVLQGFNSNLTMLDGRGEGGGQGGGSLPDYGSSGGGFSGGESSGGGYGGGPGYGGGGSGGGYGGPQGGGGAGPMDDEIPF